MEENYSLYVTESDFFRIMIPALMEDADFIGSIIKDSLLGIAFAILGCFGLLKATVAKPKSQASLDQIATASEALLQEADASTPTPADAESSEE